LQLATGELGVEVVTGAGWSLGLGSDEAAAKHNLRRAQVCSVAMHLVPWSSRE
jgi:hypothetical protein